MGRIKEAYYDLKDLMVELLESGISESELNDYIKIHLKNPNLYGFYLANKQSLLDEIHEDTGIEPEDLDESLDPDNVTPAGKNYYECMRVASELLEAGLEPYEIDDEMEHMLSANAYEFWLENKDDILADLDEGDTYENGQQFPGDHEIPEDDDEEWIDPAGGTHYGQEDDPAHMYESGKKNNWYYKPSAADVAQANREKRIFLKSFPDAIVSISSRDGFVRVNGHVAYDISAMIGNRPVDPQGKMLKAYKKDQENYFEDAQFPIDEDDSWVEPNKSPRYVGKLAETLVGKERQQERSIDLRGPSGNAYVILGMAKNLTDQLKKADPKKYNWEQINAEMTAGDYNNLVHTFDRYFGDYVTIYGADVLDDHQGEYNEMEECSESIDEMYIIPLLEGCNCGGIKKPKPRPRPRGTRRVNEIASNPPAPPIDGTPNRILEDNSGDARKVAKMIAEEKRDSKYMI